MDLARLLHPHDLEQSDHTLTVGVVYSPAQPYERAVGRARPQRPRMPPVKSLQEQVKALQSVVDHLPYVLRDLDELLPTTLTANDRMQPGDHDAQRICAFLKRTIVLTMRAHKEIAKRTEYLRLLKSQLEGSTNVRKLMRGLSLSRWFWMGERWRLLTLDYYEPLSVERCFEIVEETLEAITTHQLSQATNATRTDSFGWRDSVELDDSGHYIRILTRKTLWQLDIDQFVVHSWAIFGDADLYKKYHLGDKCEIFLQILQQISPDVMIVQSVEKYPDLVQLTHSLGVISRVKTKTGYKIVFRSIESPQLLRLMKAEGLSLGENFFWETYDVVHRDDHDVCDAVCYTLAGSVGSDDPTYAKRMRDEVLIALVRNEMKLTDTSILPIESATEEDRAVASDCNATP